MAESDLLSVTCKLSELQENEIKELEFGEGKVLLVKEKGHVYAFGNKCTHQGALLKSGVYCNGRIRCPWHGACFNVKSGDIEDYPGLDSLQTFAVTLRGEEVVVSGLAKQVKETKRVKAMVKASPSDSRLFLLVGGGPASLLCAETLRQEGFQGRILLVSKENVLPYDRPKLSKAMSVTANQILLRPEEFYKDLNIELYLGKEVVELDAANQTAKLNDGNQFKYHKAFVATGGIPRTLPVPGMGLGNIFQLRVPSDAQSINNNIDGKDVVIVGSSFIGMEAASCIAKKVKSLTVIGMEKVPFERVLGLQIGAALQKLHEKKGVKFKMERVVKEFQGRDGKISAVILDNGDSLPAEIAIIGAGIIPATNFLKGVTTERDASVVADEHLQAAPHLFVGGDIARYPYHLSGEKVRVEHWGMAHFHGKVAALNMIDRGTIVDSVPYFWTTQYGKSLRYCGHAISYDSFHVEGSVEDLAFVAYYGKGGKVVAAASLGKDPVVSAVAELLANHKIPSFEEVKKIPSGDLVKRLNA